MAIFASTTLGSGDPSRAMSIKALEARAQALAAAQAKQEAPTSMPSPWQGAGYLANTVADSLLTRRADQQAAAGRQDLANTIAGIGPEGPNPQQQGHIMMRDPETGRAYMQEIAAKRAAAAEVQARKEAAAEAARTAEVAANAQETRLAGRPKTDIAQINADAAAGRMSEEERRGGVKKLTDPPVAEQAAIAAQQDANIDLQSTVAGLREAQGLLASGKVYSGGGAEFKETAGKYAPNALSGVLGVDAESTKATQRYNQIVSPQVLDVLSKLKGASSDRDMMFAINTLNDKSADAETKKKALTTLLAKAEAHLKASEGRLTEMGGKKITVETPPPAGAAPAAGGAPAAAPTTTPPANSAAMLEEAKQAIAAGRSRQGVIAKLKSMGIDPAGL